MNLKITESSEKYDRMENFLILRSILRWVMTESISGVSYCLNKPTFEVRPKSSKRLG